MGHTAVTYAPILLNGMQKVNIFFSVEAPVWLGLRRTETVFVMPFCFQLKKNNNNNNNITEIKI